MLAEQRREEILNLIEQEGFIRISNLGERFNVTDMTIRRDIDYLSELGLVRRVHGGAVYGPGHQGGRTAQGAPAAAGEPENDESMNLATTFLKRNREFPGEKELIGKRAQAMVRPGSTIIVDGGSTNEAFARNLDPNAPLKVITHALNVAFLLSAFENIELLVPGGILNRLTMTFSGSEVTRLYEELNADTAFVSASGVSLEKGLTDPLWLDASIKKAIVRSSSRVVLLIDSHKFELVSARTFASLSEVDAVVTDSGLDHEIVQRYSDAGVRLELV
jgi:DeoR family transcriptional regulator of aga operon